jgi:hypothetical protein
MWLEANDTPNAAPPKIYWPCKNMIIAFAVIEHSQSYHEFYDELLDYVKRHFLQVESGVQGDAWIWITRERAKSSR